MYFKSDSESEPRKIVSSTSCGGGPGEITIRTAHCNFKCAPCFAAGYSHMDKVKERELDDIVEIDDPATISEYFNRFLDENRGSLSGSDKSEFNWLRIVGGEPILNRDYLTTLMDFLNDINDRSDIFGGKVLIQTNGMFLGSKAYEEIEALFEPAENFDGQIVIEFSIKGGNEREFFINTGRKEEDFSVPFKGVEHLQKISDTHGNVDFVAIAGIGPNSGFIKGESGANRITLYDPETDKAFFHPSNWAKKFEELHDLIADKYPQFDGKMPMAGLEDKPGWGLKGLKNAKKEIPDHVYDTYDDKKNEAIEESMKDLKKHFLFTDPGSYYSMLFS